MANVGPTSRFANMKSFNFLVYQHKTNVGPSIFVKAHVFSKFYETNAMIHCISITHNYFDKSMIVILVIVVCLQGRLICLILNILWNWINLIYC